ncbi:MAG TPA: histidine kinase [Niastella sp.]
MNKAKQLSMVQAQWIIWVILLVIHIISLRAYDPLIQAVVYSVIIVTFYGIIFYGNASFLIPKLYIQGHRILYVISSLAFISLIALGRFYTTYLVYNRFFAEKPSPFNWGAVVYSAVSVLLVFISGILFYIAMNYFRLRGKQEELQKKNAEAELNLLKTQVQPHFLFNTINNIYSIAQRESPATAALLEQLSAIMRYFVDEAPKNRVKLQEELTFVKGYIELEKLRMRFPLEVRIVEEGIDNTIEVPPMLLIPLVENVFKHGIDKRRCDNFIDLSLTKQTHRLIIEVRNRIVRLEDTNSKSEKGLHNLKSRLNLLYSTNYSLKSEEANGIYHIQLNFPV